MLLTIFILSIIAVFVVAYITRDKSQDEYKQQQFINSITGGPLSNDKYK